MNRAVDTFEPLPWRRQEAFQNFLARRYEAVPLYLKSSPFWTPYETEASEQEKLITIQLALQTGLQAMLAAYRNDARLQRLLYPRLDEATLNLLDTLQDVPLAPQFLRPDYIYDREGNPKVCEINTRFIFNGNIAAVAMAEFAGSTSFINTTTYTALDQFMRTTYDGPGNTVFVQGVEREHDILLQKQRSINPISAEAGLLKIIDPRKVGRVVLELHQHELEAHLSDITDLMLEGVEVLNDPRVIHVLHDKRLLVALCDEEYMKTHVDEDTARILASSIVPSYHPAWAGRELEEAPGKVALAKGAISGKSQQQWMISIATYKEQLSEPENFVYQPRLTPPKIITPNSGTVAIAGTLPMTLQGEVFGPATVRIGEYRRLRTFRGLAIAAQRSI